MHAGRCGTVVRILVSGDRDHGFRPRPWQSDFLDFFSSFFFREVWEFRNYVIIDLKQRNKKLKGGRHSTEVAFTLSTQLAWVLFSAPDIFSRKKCWDSMTTALLSWWTVPRLNSHSNPSSTSGSRAAKKWKKVLGQIPMSRFPKEKLL